MADAKADLAAERLAPGPPLPLKDEWHLHSKDGKGAYPLVLTGGSARLRLRFWPKAEATLRLIPVGNWMDGGDLTEHLLNKLCAEICGLREVLLGDDLRILDREAQLVFPFLFQPDAPVGSHELRYAIHQQLDRIPWDIRNLVFQFRPHFWLSLQIVSRSVAATELLLDHPQLFSLWIDHLKRNEKSLTKTPNRIQQTAAGGADAALPYLNEALQQPRHLQLKCLGFPPEKYWIRLLRKIPLAEIHRIRWDWLGDFASHRMTDMQKKHFLHAKQLPASLLQALADPVTQPYVSERLFLQNLKTEKRGLQGMLHLYDRFLKRFPRAESYLSIPKKPEEMGSFSSHLADLLGTAENMQNDPPRPLPFKTPAGWTALNSLDTMVEAGFRMNNCLASNPGHYLSAKGRFYRVEKPFPATLHIDQTKNGYWFVRECTGPENRPIQAKRKQELLHQLTGYQLPQLRKMPRVLFPAEPAPSTPLYQRITNSRALAALYQSYTLDIPPEAMEKDLIEGQTAVYRMRKPKTATFSLGWDETYGWDLNGILHEDEETPGPAISRTVTHILWRHYASRHACGEALPVWDAPQLTLPNYCPVENIWELLQFRWNSGLSLSVKDLIEKPTLAFYCHIEPYTFACVAGLREDGRLQLRICTANKEFFDDYGKGRKTLLHIKKCIRSYLRTMTFRKPMLSRGNPRHKSLPPLPQPQDNHQLCEPEFIRVPILGE